MVVVLQPFMRYSLISYRALLNMYKVRPTYIRIKEIYNSTDTLNENDQPPVVSP